MSQYKSIITQLVAQVSSILQENLVTCIFDELSKIFEEEVLKQKIYDSEDQLDTYAGVALYLVDGDKNMLGIFGITMNDVNALKDDPKTAIYREHRERILKVNNAQNMQELDRMLVEYEEFVHTRLHIEAGQLEFRIKSVLVKYMWEKDEMARELRAMIEKKRGISFDDLSPAEQEEIRQSLIGWFGSDGTRNTPKHPKILEFDPNKRRR